MYSSAVTIQQCIEVGAQMFEQHGLYFGHGTDNALDEAGVLVAWGLNLGWSELEGNLLREVSESEQQKLHHLFETRVERRIPAAYITGEAWFAGHRFKVNENVLVPRSPIAELIANDFQPWISKPPGKILDLCCGSGCIGIAAALQFPDAEVSIADISPEALEVARENILLHQLGDRVTAYQSDCLDQLGGQFDLIVSNPPYVNAEDLAEMPGEYHAEPKIGLYSGADGLDLTRRILGQAHSYLSAQGSIIIEVGNSAEALENLLPGVPFMWPEFVYGGHGVFVLSVNDLLEHQSAIRLIA